MTQFRSKKDGSHYPLKGGRNVYPENNWFSTYSEQIYEVYTFDKDVYITRFNSLEKAKAYCKKNYPIKYTIKKVIGSSKTEEKAGSPPLYGFTYTIERNGIKYRVEARKELRFKTKKEVEDWLKENDWIKENNPRIIKIKRG